MLKIIIFAILFLLSCINQKLTEDDRNILITVNDFKRYDLVFPADYMKYEKYDKSLSLDGSVTTIEYKYSPESEVPSDISYISQIVEYNGKGSDQFLSEKFDELATKSIYESYGVTMKELPSPFKNQPKGKVFSLEKKGKVVGNKLFLPYERMIFEYTLIGKHIDKSNLLLEIFGDKVNLATKYKQNFYKFDYNK